MNWQYSLNLAFGWILSLFKGGNPFAAYVCSTCTKTVFHGAFINVMKLKKLMSNTSFEGVTVYLDYFLRKNI